MVAPLNWGLGHAARDIPIIRELIKRNCEVIIAADGRPLELLRKEFPQLKWIRLPGYDMKYQKSGSFSLQIILQIPKLFFSFFSERKLIRQIIDKEQPDAIISDNRFGLYSKKIPCVFITHQVRILMPPVFKWFEERLYRMHKGIAEKYTRCWIPDFSGKQNLSGSLSHQSPVPGNASFIGPLSRFSKKEVQKVYDVLIVLSGPEPQRSILDELLTKEAKSVERKVLQVRGVAEGTSEIKKMTDQFFVADFMTADQLNNAFLASDIVVARSGYSTVMDLAATGRKAIFIPTPGQTEQEHLASNFMKRKIFYSEKQSEFNLKRALEESENYHGISMPMQNDELKKQIDWLTE